MLADSPLCRSRRFWVLGLFLLFLLLFSAGLAATTEGAVDEELETTGPSAAGSRLLACRDVGGGLWFTTSNTPAVIRQCTLNVPRQGKVYISADGTLGWGGGYYETLFDINVDSTGASGSHYRHVASHSEAPPGKYNTFAITTIRASLPPGRHTIYLLGSLYGAQTGTVAVIDATLSALFIPDSEPDLVTCSDYTNATYTTAEETYQVVNECTLTVPDAQGGWVYVSADAYVDTDSDYYGAMAKLNIDESSSVANNLERQFDVDMHDTAGDNDQTVSLAGTFSVGAGSHDFYLLTKRTEGAGTVRLNWPRLNVIYSPWVSPIKPQYTNITSGHVWTTTQTGMQVVSVVNLNPTENQWAFISANAHVTATAGCIGHFRIGLEPFPGPTYHGDPDFDRFVELHADSGGVAHKALTISGLVPVAAGFHQAYLVGEKVSGDDCTIHVIDPTLTALIFELEFPIFLPLVSR